MLEALVEKGINLILPPVDEVKAGDLILGDAGGSIRMSSWPSVFGREIAADRDFDDAFQSFTFQDRSSHQASASVSLLGPILEPLGLMPGKLRNAIDSTTTLTVEVALIAPAGQTLKNFDGMLDQLRTLGAQPRSDYAERSFYIVTAAWRARGLRLHLIDAANKGVDLSADAAELLSASGQLRMTREANGVYAFTAKRPKIFGLRLREIKFADGKIMDQPTGSHKTLRSADDQPDDCALIGDEAFVRILSEEPPDH